MLIKLDHEFYVDPSYIQCIHACNYEGKYQIKIIFKNEKNPVYISHEYLTDLEELLHKYGIIISNVA